MTTTNNKIILGIFLSLFYIRDFNKVEKVTLEVASVVTISKIVLRRFVGSHRLNITDQIPVVLLVIIGNSDLYRNCYCNSEPLVIHQCPLL